MNDILRDIDNQFVDDYDTIFIYKKNLDDVLEQLGFEGFDSYNDFCIKIRNNVIQSLNNNDFFVMNNQIFSQVLNKTLRDKILEDNEYEAKIMSSLGDKTVLDFLRNSKIRALEN